MTTRPVVVRSGRRNFGTLPGLVWERRAWGDGKLLVAGVDEVGRGAWAGPLTAAAVLVPAEGRERAKISRAFKLAGVAARDSKQLSAQQRECVLDILETFNVVRATCDIPPQAIDTFGLGVANREAMCRAVALLAPEPDHVLVDAFALPELRCPHDAIVRGDAICWSIALASIVAKVHRDRIMAKLDERLPGYGFADHKGYGTARHAAALTQLGVTDEHRHSFAPIAALKAERVV